MPHYVVSTCVNRLHYLQSEHAELKNFVEMKPIFDILSYFGAINFPYNSKFHINTS